MSDEIYTVVPVGKGCSHCNAGENWDVVFRAGTDKEMGLSTSYGDKEQAENVARDCNEAYEKGKRSSKGLITECCRRQIAEDERYCPRCGWEARVLDSHEESARELRQQIDRINTVDLHRSFQLRGHNTPWHPIVVADRTDILAWREAGGGKRELLMYNNALGYPIYVAETTVSYVEEITRPVPMSAAQIKHMVDRFLTWRLPEDFNPDCGISFKRDFNERTMWPMKHEPVGTNLFSAAQAEEMVRNMVKDL